MTAHFPSLAAAVPLESHLAGSIDAVAIDAGLALDRSAQPVLYDRLDWLRLTARHIWSEVPLTVVGARIGPDAAWLPLRDGGGGHGRGFASWYTLDFAPLVTPGCSGDQRDRLLAALVRRLRGRFGRVTLWPLERNVAAELARHFRAQGWIAFDRFETAHWVAHTDGLDFEAYWARRPSRLRNTVRRRSKSAPVETRIYAHFDVDAWAAYETVYSQSWKPTEGSPDFLRALAQQEGAAGTLRLGIATRAGRPVAAQFWTVENGIATIHKLAYLQSEREHSPGTLLSFAMFRHVIEQDRPALIDYGNGDEGYKAEWMDERRERRRLQLFDPRSVAGLAGLADTIRRRVTARLRR